VCRIGDYELFDLVSLDPTTVGVIVGVDKDSCRVMTNQGRPDKPDVRICRLPDLKRKLTDKRGVVIDAARNEIRSGDIVEVIDGPLRGRNGTAQHVMRGYVFMQSRQVPDHGGYSVVQSRACRVRGGQRRTTQGSNPLATPSRHNVLASPYPHHAGGNVPQSPAPYARDGMRT
jgi:transcription elongation factor SPT5